MRTTISIPDDLGLLFFGQLQKGVFRYSMRGFEGYLAKEDRGKLKDRALKLEGILTSEEANNMEKRIKELWERWNLQQIPAL